MVVADALSRIHEDSKAIMIRERCIKQNKGKWDKHVKKQETRKYGYFIQEEKRRFRSKSYVRNL